MERARQFFCVSQPSLMGWTERVATSSEKYFPETNNQRDLSRPFRSDLPPRGLGDRPPTVSEGGKRDL